MIGEIGSTVKHKTSGKLGIVVGMPRLREVTHTVVSHDYDCEHVIADCALELIKEKVVEAREEDRGENVEERDEHDGLYEGMETIEDALKSDDVPF
jgi:hypothetical protein